MTKIYDIIHLNNHMYMVDKEAIEIVAGDYWVHPKKVIFPYTETYYKAFKSLLTRGVSKVIASTDPSLGLPLLPAIEGKIDYNGFNEAWSKVIAHIDTTLFDEKGIIAFTTAIKEVWKEGYKAAKAKRYSEEDMRKAYFNGGNFKDKDEWDNYLKSLNPLPKQVEVEIEMIGNPHEWINTHKVNKNNIVQVIKWIYEKD